MVVRSIKSILTLIVLATLISCSQLKLPIPRLSQGQLQLADPSSFGSLSVEGEDDLVSFQWKVPNIWGNGYPFPQGQVMLTCREGDTGIHGLTFQEQLDENGPTKGIPIFFSFITSGPVPLEMVFNPKLVGGGSAITKARVDYRPETENVIKSHFGDVAVDVHFGDIEWDCDKVGTKPGDFIDVQWDSIILYYSKTRYAQQDASAKTTRIQRIAATPLAECQVTTHDDSSVLLKSGEDFVDTWVVINQKPCPAGFSGLVLTHANIKQRYSCQNGALSHEEIQLGNIYETNTCVNEPSPSPPPITTRAPICDEYNTGSAKLPCICDSAADAECFNQYDGMEKVIDRLYSTYLCHAPDAAGKYWWLYQLLGHNNSGGELKCEAQADFYLSKYNDKGLCTTPTPARYTSLPDCQLIQK